MATEPTTKKEEIEKAIEEVKDAMLENLAASQDETKAALRKKAAHYTLLKAKERLSGLERELMSL